MNGLKIFENPEFGQVRTVVDENGTPWFVGKDVATALGYSNTKDALARHVDGHVTVHKTVKVTGKGQQHFIDTFLNK